MTGAVLLAGFGVRQRLAAEPLILPSLLANRGFTVGLLPGISSIYDVAIGDVAPGEAGSASGSLSAV